MNPRTEPGTIDPVALLTGSWTFERRVEDRLAGVTGHAEGEAVFLLRGEGLCWSESGRLTVGGHTFDASRVLTIIPDHEGWMVNFEDGRPFHRLDLSRAVRGIEHPCRDDLYSGKYVVTEGPDGPELSTEWIVTGPAKDQLILTRYRRTAHGDRP